MWRGDNRRTMPFTPMSAHADLPADDAVPGAAGSWRRAGRARSEASCNTRFARAARRCDRTRTLDHASRGEAPADAVHRPADAGHRRRAAARGARCVVARACARATAICAARALLEPDGVQAFAAAYPATAIDALTQLVTDARAERERGAPPRKTRALFRELKRIVDDGSP